MADIKILDTGFISNKTRATQTQLSDANRAGYTGSAVTSFTLKVNSIRLSGDVNTEHKPIIGTLTPNSSSLVSVNNRVFNINGIISRTIVTSGWSVNNIYQLSRLDRTYGLKLLYVSATADPLTALVDAMGQANLAGNFSDGSPTDDNGTVSTTTPYILGRVKNFRIEDMSTNASFLHYSFDFEESG